MKKEKSILVVDYKERIIWLDGVITRKTASRFGVILKKLNKLKVAPIVLYIRGPGGDPWSTFSMMSDIANSSSQIGCVAHQCVTSGSFTLTQAGFWRAALPGTKFIFHSAEGVFFAQRRDAFRTQDELENHLERLRVVDTIQFLWFAKKGRPVELIYDFLKTNRILSLPATKKLGLIDYHYAKKDFLKDKRIAHKLIKAQSKS